MTTDPRTLPPLRGDETTSLLAYLDYHRDTLLLKTAGLDAGQLSRTLEPSTMTLGGMLKHLAVVESSWFSDRLAGGDLMAPFDTADWDADRDWEWHSAGDDTPGYLRDLLAASIAASRRITANILAEGGLDALSARTLGTGERFSLRWLLLHMIEEYARHNGHADLIRESIDGQVGE